MKRQVPPMLIVKKIYTFYYQPQPASYNQDQQYLHDTTTKQFTYITDYDR